MRVIWTTTHINSLTIITITIRTMPTTQGNSAHKAKLSKQKSQSGCKEAAAGRQSAQSNARVKLLAREGVCVCLYFVKTNICV